MAVFGLTMALPFVALSLVPGRLKALPRSGEWMNTLKHFLGFVEVAAALKFLSNADIVWGTRILSRELFLLSWGILFLLAALYLFGVFGRLQRPGTKRLVSGAASLLFALYCLWGMQGASLDRVMTAIAPNYSGGRLTPAWYHSGEDWTIVKDDYQLALERARQQEKLLFVNFTGHSCINCRLNELYVFPKRRVASVLREHFVEARLHTDDLDPAIRSRNRALQQELAHSVATPFYLVQDPETSQLVGGSVSGVTTVGAFREYLLDALEESKDQIGRR
jgi:thiol:disulfide interchange protein DsbD